jgi:hypothetical protein
MCVMLRTCAKRVTADCFKAKYPPFLADAVAARRIELAQRYAAIEGGMMAGACSAAVAATIGTAGGASPLTVPAGLTAFGVDLLYTTRLQLRLAHDLAVRYRVPIDLDDPEDLYDLFKVAIGVRAGELFRSGIAKIAPEAARVGGEAAILTFAIPMLTIPISAGFNHWSTGAIGRAARQVYRDKATAHETAARLSDAVGPDALLLLKLVFVSTHADGKVGAEEAWLLHALTRALAARGEDAALDAFRGLVHIDPEGVVDEVAARPEEARARLFDAAVEAVAVDHELKTDELRFLRTLADRCGLDVDEARLRRRAAAGKVGR